LGYSSTTDLLFGRGVIRLDDLTPPRYLPFVLRTDKQTSENNIMCFEKPGAFLTKRGDLVYFIFRGEAIEPEYGMCTLIQILDPDKFPPVAKALLLL